MALHWVWDEQYRDEWGLSYKVSAGELYAGEFSHSFLKQPKQATCSSWPSVSSDFQTCSPSHVLLTEDDEYLHETFFDFYLSAVCSSLFTLVWFFIGSGVYLFLGTLFSFSVQAENTTGLGSVQLSPEQLDVFC